MLTKMNMSDSTESDQLGPRVLDKCLYVKAEREYKQMLLNHSLNFLFDCRQVHLDIWMY